MRSLLPNHFRFMIFVNIYMAYTLSLFVILLGWIGIQMYKIGFTIWLSHKVVAYSICLIAIGAFLRILLFSIDVHTIRGILPAAAYQMLFSVAFICWCSVLFCVAIYWMELVETAKLSSFKHKRLYSFFLLGLSYVLLIPTCIAFSIFQDSTVILYLYNIAILLVILAFVSMTIYFGIGLRRMFQKSPKLNHLKVFLKKILNHMILCSIIFVLSALSAVLFLILGSNRWWYIAIHASIRFEEFALCGCVLYIFSRKRPPTPERSRENSELKKVPIVFAASASLRKMDDSTITLSAEEETREESNENQCISKEEGEDAPTRLELVISSLLGKRLANLAKEPDADNGTEIACLQNIKGVTNFTGMLMIRD
ncbi:hypothetical protein PROFUN_09868 [Planoprotostelium fungivorum]|uniref:THH1/TOM1/TOM3 domain-containing protein n=1 Tax=Planoprotostelium fungivorum TaxID=1890364 RepID=A0A2P6NGD5_9EUKA|nr:hypothetical protein PROFUN_09868 [Planoprotostelium fungivorum]